jgi:hypothetical protein
MYAQQRWFYKLKVTQNVGKFFASYSAWKLIKILKEVDLNLSQTHLIYLIYILLTYFSMISINIIPSYMHASPVKGYQKIQMLP